MIFVPNQLVGAPAGTNVTIDCNTEAYPRAMSYWFLGEEMILSNEKYTTDIMENSYRAYMRLTIRNLQVGDFGNYRCISKNSLGETEGSIRLYGKTTQDLRSIPLYNEKNLYATIASTSTEPLLSRTFRAHTPLNSLSDRGIS